jgi:hypothetical protein
MGRSGAAPVHDGRFQSIGNEKGRSVERPFESVIKPLDIGDWSERVVVGAR